MGAWAARRGGLALGAAAAWTHFHGGLSHYGLADFVHAPLRVLLFGGMSAALLVCALGIRQARGRVGLGLARLGDASYALYLCHILVLTSLYMAVTAWNGPTALRGGVWLAAMVRLPPLEAMPFIMIGPAPPRVEWLSASVLRVRPQQE